MSTPVELAPIVDAIHDRWFDVGDVSFDEGARTVSVRFRPDHRNRLSDNLLLVIRDVDAFRLEESEGIGLYDFNEFRYSPEDRALTIRTGIPLTFQLVVSSLNLELKRLGPG